MDFGCSSRDSGFGCKGVAFFFWRGGGVGCA